MGKVKPVPTRRQCLCCLKWFRKPQATPPGRWMKQNYCSKSCRLKANPLKPNLFPPNPKKVCPACDQIFYPRDGEQYCKWKLRVVCCDICNAAHSKGQKVTEIPPDEPVSIADRLRWLRLSHSECGRKKRMTAAQFCDSIGIPRNCYRHWEFRRVVPPGRLKEVAEALRLSEEVFTCPPQKFVRIVTAAKLRAFGPPPSNVSTLKLSESLFENEDS